MTSSDPTQEKLEDSSRQNSKKYFKFPDLKSWVYKKKEPLQPLPPGNEETSQVVFNTITERDDPKLGNRHRVQSICKEFEADNLDLPTPEQIKAKLLAADKYYGLTHKKAKDAISADGKTTITVNENEKERPSWAYIMERPLLEQYVLMNNYIRKASVMAELENIEVKTKPKYEFEIESEIPSPSDYDVDLDHYKRFSINSQRYSQQLDKQNKNSQVIFKSPRLVAQSFDSRIKKDVQLEKEETFIHPENIKQRSRDDNKDTEESEPQVENEYEQDSSSINIAPLPEVDSSQKTWSRFAKQIFSSSDARRKSFKEPLKAKSSETEMDLDPPSYYSSEKPEMIFKGNRKSSLKFDLESRRSEDKSFFRKNVFNNDSESSTPDESLPPEYRRRSSILKTGPTSKYETQKIYAEQENLLRRSSSPFLIKPVTEKVKVEPEICQQKPKKSVEFAPKLKVYSYVNPPSPIPISDENITPKVEVKPPSPVEEEILFIPQKYVTPLEVIRAQTDPKMHQPTRLSKSLTEIGLGRQSRQRNLKTNWPKDSKTFENSEFTIFTPRDPKQEEQSSSRSSYPIFDRQFDSLERHLDSEKRASSLERHELSSERLLSSSERRPTSSERRPTTSSERRPTSSERRPTSSERRPTSSERRPTSSERRPTSSERRPTSSERRPSNLEKGISSSRRPNSIERELHRTNERTSSSDRPSNTLSSTDKYLNIAEKERLDQSPGRPTIDLDRISSFGGNRESGRSKSISEGQRRSTLGGRMSLDNQNIDENIEDKQDKRHSLLQHPFLDLVPDERKEKEMERRKTLDSRLLPSFTTFTEDFNIAGKKNERNSQSIQKPLFKSKNQSD